MVAMVFATSGLVNANSSIEKADDCFDTAIASLELTEKKYGTLSDEDATNYLNYVYSNCVTWMATS